MTELAEYRSHLISRYAGQVEELARSVGGIPDELLQRELEAGGWSTHQVVCHIRDVEARAFVPRISRILEEDSPDLPSFDPEAWMEEHYDPGEAIEAILGEIRRVRTIGTEAIRSLPGSQWSRTGVHSSFGVRTLQWWVEYAVSHFDVHLEQLARSREA